MEGTKNPEIEQSPNDKNRYDVFTLDNGLQCLLIQDNNSKEIGKGGNLASVSIAVNCGCLNDPIKRQGLAHFLEHMIFMGSTKYPDENEFSNLICAHGGYSNAYTDMELTNYQFRVDAKGLYKALDMFAWLLIDPLLIEDAQEREIKSIESEYEVNYPYDSSRRFQLLCSNTSSKNHPIHRFTWGNLRSLKGQKPELLLQDLREFFNEQYSADRMKLVVQMKTEDDMVELKSKIIEIYSQVPNKNLGTQNFSIQKDGKPVSLPYESNLNEMIVFNGVKNQNHLYALFTFEIGDKKKMQLAFYLISQIIGHEGKGSLYQDLKEQGLILRIKAGEDYQFKTLMNALEISFTLTELGVVEYETVLAALFRYIKVIIDKLQQLKSFDDFELFKESRIMSHIGFTYYKIPDPLDNVCEIASEMIFTKDIQRIIRDTYEDQVIDEIELSFVIEQLSKMTLNRAKIVINGKGIMENEKFQKQIGKKVKTETWFKTKYAVLKKNEQVIQKLTNGYDISKITLPTQNPFIPEDFSSRSTLTVTKNEWPKLLHKDPKLCEIWHHQDHIFKMPRSLVHIIFCIPQLFNSPKRRGYFAVYIETLIEKVTAEIGYEAVLADVSYSAKVFENLGYKIKFTGYNDKLLNFINIFLKIMYDSHQKGFEEWQVKLQVEKQLKSYKNLNVEVDQRNTNNRIIYLLQHQYHAKLVIKELENFDYQDFNQLFVGQTLIKDITYFKLFAAGNITADEVLSVGQMVKDTMQIRQNESDQTLKTRVRILKDGETVEWDCVHEDSGKTGDDESGEDDDHSDEDESMEDLTEDKNQGSSAGSEDSDGSQPEKTENNSCISLYYQSKNHDLHTGVCLQLLESILDERFYDELRNKEQCGYYVAATRRQTRGIHGFTFTIESAIYDPLQLQEKILAFISATYDKLVKEPEIIKNFHEGLIAKKKEGFKDIREEAGYLFSQMKDFAITPQPVSWDRVEKEIQYLEKEVTAEQILALFRGLLIEQPRLAIFRAFAEKYKEIAQKLEIEALVTTGQYTIDDANETIEMFLTT